MDSLYIVMPAYNEEDNIQDVVDAWYPLLQGKADNSRLVIADSGSSDRTHAILLELKERKYPQLEILSDTIKYHGPKLRALYDHAIKNNIDYVFQTDSDGQTFPSEFGGFWELRGEYDCILGNRSTREDGKDRAFVEMVVCLLLRIIFGIKVPDANAPFRLMKCEVVKKYLYNLPEKYMLTNIMMTTYLKYYGEKLIFREISFRPREKGEGSLNIVKIVKIGWNALGEFYGFRKQMKHNR